MDWYDRCAIEDDEQKAALKRAQVKGEGYVIGCYVDGSGASEALFKGSPTGDVRAYLYRMAIIPLETYNRLKALEVQHA
jgi:hypothetical protein